MADHLHDALGKTLDAYDKRHRSVRLEDEAVALVEHAIDGAA